LLLKIAIAIDVSENELFSIVKLALLTDKAKLDTPINLFPFIVELTPKPLTPSRTLKIVLFTIFTLQLLKRDIPITQGEFLFKEHM